MLRAWRSCPNIVCRRFARSPSPRRESVKHEASVNAAPNPRIVCAGFAGSTVTSAGAAFFAIFVHGTSGPAASRFPLLSVTSVCAGFAGTCSSFASTLAFNVTPNAEAAAAPSPSPAYFKTSRRVVTLGPRSPLNRSRRLSPSGLFRRTAYCKTYYLGIPQRLNNLDNRTNSRAWKSHSVSGSAKLRLGNTYTEGQIDGVAGTVEHGCHERSHCSLTPAKLASLSQDACAGAGPRAQPEEIQRDMRNRSRQRAWRPAAAEARGGGRR